LADLCPVVGMMRPGLGCAVVVGSSQSDRGPGLLGAPLRYYTVWFVLRTTD
jgi:hypothetical protein